MPLPLTVDCGHECVKIPDRPGSLRDDLGHPWEIMESFEDGESLMKALEQGVEAIRIQSGELLEVVKPGMVGVHVDGQMNEGVLRSVLKWADGCKVDGSAAWDLVRVCQRM